jgi:uncharacterized protein (TIGR02001 family)
MTKLRQVCAAAALAMMASAATHAQNATANVGIMTDYIFRGYYQSDATAFGGLDVETDGGFYVGTWGANLKHGLEYDIYLGYEGGGDDFTWYTGVTGYYYSDNFDDSYEELNLGFSWGFVSIDYALGDYKNDSAVSSGGKPEQTYQYVGATFAPERGPYYFVGRTDYKNVGRAAIEYDEFGVAVGVPWEAGRISGTGKNGYWFEIGKSFEIMDDLELNVAALYSSDVPAFGSTTPSSVQLGRGELSLTPPFLLDDDSNLIPNDDPSVTPINASSRAEFAFVLTLTKTINIGD